MAGPRATELSDLEDAVPLIMASTESLYQERPNSHRFSLLRALHVAVALSVAAAMMACLRSVETLSRARLVDDDASSSLSSSTSHKRACASANTSSCSLIAVGPSSAWRPRKSNCSMKASCRNYDVWHISGRLGNRLMTLGGTMLQAARLNLCFAWVPPDDRHYLREIIDFPDELLDMAEPQGNTLPHWWYYPGHDNCVKSAWDPFEVVNASQLMQDYFVSTGRLKCNALNFTERPELGPQGVILHMRSGDIMQPSTSSGFDPQPPCNFYASVLEQGNKGGPFEHALIVTQPDFRNPCIQAIQGWYPSRVKVQSRSVREDACLIATAQNLAIAAFSTFDTGLARLNVNLKNLYIPMGEDQHVHYWTGNDPYPWPSHFVNWILVDEGMPYAQHVYSFPGYDTTWWNWEDRVRKMRDVYPMDSIINRTIPSRGDLTMRSDIG